MSYESQFLMVRDAYLASIHDRKPSRILETFVKEQKLLSLVADLDQAHDKPSADMYKALKAFDDYRPVYLNKIGAQIAKEVEPAGCRASLPVYSQKLQHLSESFKKDCEAKVKAEHNAATSPTGNNMEVKRGVSRVKRQLEEFHETNAGFVKAIKVDKEKVKALKELVKKIEAGAPHEPGPLQAQIRETRASLEKAASEAKGVFDHHNEWYLAGPRKGVIPLLKAVGLKEEDLLKSDREALAAPLHEISEAANEVIHLYRTDIEAALHALHIRLDNLESHATKSHAGALEDVRAYLTREFKILTVAMENSIAEMKANEVDQRMKQFQAKKGEVYERWLPLPNFVAAEIEGEKNKLNGIPGKIENIDKQVSRLIKSVPETSRDDLQVADLMNKLRMLADANRRNLAEAKAVLEESIQVLTEHLHAHQ